MNPGVGSYNINENSKEREKINIILKSRLGFFYDDDIKMHKDSLSPQAYYVNDKVVNNLRFNNISFGKGDRMKVLDCKYILY